VAATDDSAETPPGWGSHDRTGVAELVVMPTKKRGGDPRDPGGSFVTHRKYLDAFALLAGYTNDIGEAGALETLTGRLHGVRWSDKPKASDGVAPAERGMRSAWGTELLMLTAAESARDDPAALRWMGNWAVVQAYYACYHAFLALARVNQNSPAPNHDAAKNAYASMWTQSPLDLAPWTLRVDRTGASSGRRRQIDIMSVAAFANATPLNAEAKAVQAIRTTRDGAIEDREARDRAKLKRRLSPSENADAAAAVRGHTMLHYLYRLRRRLNYLDADMFAKGAGTAQRASETVDRLRYIVASTCLVHERRIAASIGPDAIVRWMDEFLVDCEGRNTTLAIRRELTTTISRH
jgi:hypothetical protein